MYEEFTALLPEQATEYMAGQADQPVRAEIARRIAGDRPMPTVLDAGCGPGYGAEHYHPALYTGVDISPALVEVARRRHPNHVFQVGSLQNLPYPDRYFKHTVCKSVLPHVPSEEIAVAILREIARVTHKSLWIAWHGSPWVPEGASALIQRVPGHCGWIVNQNYYNRSVLLGSLAGAGFPAHSEHRWHGFEVWEMRR